MLRQGFHTRLHLLSWVLLTCILVAGCASQSIPTSIDGEAVLGSNGIAERTGSDQRSRAQTHVTSEEQEKQASEYAEVQSSSEDPAANREQTVENSGTAENSDMNAESVMQDSRAEQAGSNDPNGSYDLDAQGAQEVRSQESDAGDDLASDEISQASREDAQAGNETLQQPEWDEDDNTLTFKELYASVGVRGIELSDKVNGLTGKEVEMSGYMAPPLTAGVKFFVLTKALMAVCPFCSTDADWPTDIVVVYLPDGEELKPTEHPVKVTGTLDTGSFTDEDTGFVSLVRIYADKVEVMK